MKWVWGPHCVGVADKEHGFPWPGMSSVIITAHPEVKVHCIMLHTSSRLYFCK